jgi:hypothetical protein
MNIHAQAAIRFAAAGAVSSSSETHCATHALESLARQTLSTSGLRDRLLPPVVLLLLWSQGPTQAAHVSATPRIRFECPFRQCCPHCPPLPHLNSPNSLNWCVHSCSQLSFPLLLCKMLLRLQTCGQSSQEQEHNFRNRGSLSPSLLTLTFLSTFSTPGPRWRP